jgi:hypothetical protein
MNVTTEMVQRALSAMEVAHNDPNVTSYGAMRRAIEAALSAERPLTVNELANEEFMLGRIGIEEFERRIRV